MRLTRWVGFALVAGLALTVARAEEIKSGPEKQAGGPVLVEAITGEEKGNTLCYFCKYNGQARPAVVMIFTQKADDNLVKVVKSVDEVQKNNAKLGTVVVGVSGVEPADFEKIQTENKLTTPL